MYIDVYQCDPMVSQFIFQDNLLFLSPVLCVVSRKMPAASSCCREVLSFAKSLSRTWNVSSNDHTAEGKRRTTQIIADFYPLISNFSLYEILEWSNLRVWLKSICLWVEYFLQSPITWDQLKLVAWPSTPLIFWITFQRKCVKVISIATRLIFIGQRSTVPISSFLLKTLFFSTCRCNWGCFYWYNHDIFKLHVCWDNQLHFYPAYS